MYYEYEYVCVYSMSYLYVMCAYHMDCWMSEYIYVIVQWVL